MKVRLTEGEVLCLDHVLTLHSWDADLLGRLGSRYRPYRYAVAKCLVDPEALLDLDKPDVRSELFDEVISMVPPIFAVGGMNVGKSLKVKLYRMQWGEIDDEDKDKDKRSGAREDQADDKASAAGGSPAGD